MKKTDPDLAGSMVDSPLLEQEMVGDLSRHIYNRDRRSLAQGLTVRQKVYIYSVYVVHMI